MVIFQTNCFYRINFMAVVVYFNFASCNPLNNHTSVLVMQASRYVFKKTKMCRRWPTTWIKWMRFWNRQFTVKYQLWFIRTQQYQHNQIHLIQEGEPPHFSHIFSNIIFSDSAIQSKEGYWNHNFMLIQRNKQNQH